MEMPVGICGQPLGLAALTRSTFLVLPFVLLPWAFRPLQLGRARQLAVALAAAALVLSPWVARNRLTLGAWIPGTTTAGHIALMGNYRGASGSLDADALRHVTSGLPPSFWRQSEPLLVPYAVIAARAGLERLRRGLTGTTR